MISRKWQFTLDGISHEVSFTTRFLNQYTAQLDGKVVLQKKVSLTGEICQTLDLPGHEVELGIIPGTTSHEAYLRVDGEIIPPSGNQKKKIGWETKRRFDKLENWNNFSKDLGFEFFTKPEIEPAFRFRLAGYFSSLLVIILPIWRQYQKNVLPGMLVTIRHAPLSEEEILALSKSEELGQFLKKSKIAKDDLSISASLTALFILDMGKSVITRQSQIIREFLPLMARHLKAPLDECDGLECKKVDDSRHLVLINATPYVMCSDCISRINEFGEKKKAEYEKQPTNLKQSILKGSLTGLLCAIVLGMIPVIIPTIDIRLLSISIFLIFALVNNAIFKTLNKWTVFSTIASLIITEASFFLSLLISGLGEWILHQQSDFSWRVLLSSILKIPNLTDFLSGNIFLVIFLFIPITILSSINHRNSVSRAFSPEVEVLTELPMK